MDIHPASFRDPSGFVFTSNHKLYRAIAPSYFQHYQLSIASGLLATLQKQELILHHAEEKIDVLADFSSHKIIKPEVVPFISYPYEWCFSQLKAAALLTLKIQKESLTCGMILKDASAYNVQFIGYKPIFIDTLSFEKYSEGMPWAAYKQFCQHFLAPLALMAYRQVELAALQSNFVDGIPLPLASSLLPLKALFNGGIASHLLLHSSFQKNKNQPHSSAPKKAALSKRSLLALIQHLEITIESLHLKNKKSNWTPYSTNHSYTPHTISVKEKTLSAWLEKSAPNCVWDLGCNTGMFALLASRYSNHVVAMDADHHCIEQMYLQNKSNKKILPLVVNVSSPSPNIGWANKERTCIQERGKANVLLALALIHHLRIANNVPFIKIAHYLHQLCEQLIIEFVPKEDSMVKGMLSSREDIFPDYTLKEFTKAFEKYFLITQQMPLEENGRVLFLMNNKTI
jgi:ribosomal protein L11 methylase PrmA